MILPSERHFSAGLSDKLERASATLSADAFRLYLLGLLIADAHGGIPKAEAAIIHDVMLDQSIDVGWTANAAGTTVWARERHAPDATTFDRVDGTRRVSSAYKRRTS